MNYFLDAIFILGISSAFANFQGKLDDIIIRTITCLQLLVYLYYKMYNSTLNNFYVMTKVSSVMECDITSQGFILVSSGAEIRPLSQWDLGDFFPNLKKKSQSKKNNIFFFLIFIQSLHTHKLHGDNIL